MEKSRAERMISKAEGLDAIVIMNDGSPYLDSTFWYLTELSGGVFEGAIAIVGKDGRLDVIVSEMESEAAAAGKGNIYVYKKRGEREYYLRKALAGAKRVGFNADRVSYSSVAYVEKTVKNIRVNDAAPAILSTMTVKTQKEIEQTRKACKISSQVAKEIPDMLSEGITEKEMAFKMDFRMRELGGMGNAFETISAFGANSSRPHHSPTDYKLAKGDAALFDFGTKYEGYCSDMTRTVFLSRPQEILARAYEVVLEAQTAGIEKYRDGAPAKEADLAARKVIDESEFKGKFIHAFGHGIGMDVHQGISVSPRSKHILREGNIVSAEPGIYIQGVGGIRIEDTCLITKNGCERLTDFDRRITFV
ncbi:Xaa-Pro dipeptidase [Candidatus Methanoplasma termitum]|uniref:PepQ protein n=1 Tax=Candidatus Methanoplasma termitum TaxID=1577791 RepID=A0A0A7LEP9_9ARCH|nr:aminopeptidase P family protein [Candidatus Methanoplasma termitum]AIZ56001.1 Xaa-Pro dipeptidase [Candidatus Methanoplasma termitum]MCL2333949.1 aminopeptidase P family protein [Candidatus Methanoplasma sp.]